MRICVYGAASDDIAEKYKTAAYALGKWIGENGHTLVYGAGDTGVMGATARGVHDAHGKIVGIAPYFFDKPGVLYPHCTEMHFTDTMRERKDLLEQNSDLFVMAPGGIGTWDEFFEILTLRSLGQTDKDIYIFNTDGYYDALLTLLDKGTKEGFIAAEVADYYRVLETEKDFATIGTPH